MTDNTVETIVTIKDWFLGYSAADTLVEADTTTITVDGVVFSADGGMVSLIQNQAKTLNLTVRNCIANDVYNSFVFTCEGGSASAGSYVRNLNFENIRFENYTRAYAYVFLRQNADKFILDNVYFAATCTAARSQIMSGWEISSRATSAELTVKNSTFMIKGSQACFIDPALQFKSTSISLANLSEIKIAVENCKFVGSPNNTVFRPQFSQDHSNVKIIFSGNTVVDCTKPALWQNTGSKVSPECYEIDNNTFINCNNGTPISNLYVTAKATATNTLCIVNNEVVAPTGDTTVQYSNWYANADKTRLAYANTPIELKAVQRSTETLADGKVNLRFIVALDKLDDLKEIGIYLTADENASDTKILTAKQSVDTVYTKIIASEPHGIVEYTADDLGGKYLMAVIVENVPADVTFTVQPYAVYKDGVNVVTKAFDVAVANSEVDDFTASEKAYRVDVPNADSLATYNGTTVNENTLTFSYTGADADDVTAYAELLKAEGFVAGANAGEYVNTATDTKVVVTLEAGTLYVSAASCL